MSELAWPLVAIIAIVVTDYRLSQYLNPPLRGEMLALKVTVENYKKHIHELTSKVNALMVDKGFK